MPVTKIISNQGRNHALFESSDKKLKLKLDSLRKATENLLMKTFSKENSLKYS